MKSDIFFYYKLIHYIQMYAIVERSFSLHRCLKNYSRSTLMQNKTSSLTLLRIKSELLRQIEWSGSGAYQGIFFIGGRGQNW